MPNLWPTSLGRFFFHITMSTGNGQQRPNLYAQFSMSIVVHVKQHNTFKPIINQTKPKKRQFKSMGMLVIMISLKSVSDGGDRVGFY